MSEKPMLFNAEMVRAILAGRKTQTRRPLKPQPKDAVFFYNTERHPRTRAAMLAEYQTPIFKDDLLYVRETWSTFRDGYVYRADLRTSDGNLWPNPLPPDPEYIRWYPSIHMPKAAARIWLRVKRVEMQRVTDITEADAAAEGVAPAEAGYKVAFLQLWEKLYGCDAKYAWVIEFERAGHE